MTLTDLATPENLEAQIAVATQAFAILAGMEVFPSPPNHAADDDQAAISARIQYMGESQGSLRIECSPSIAFTFTHLVMGVETPGAFNSDVGDAVGELINTIGGNLKGLLSCDTRIDTPEVFAKASEMEVMAPHMQLSCLHFDSAFGAFRLVLSTDFKKDVRGRRVREKKA
ncbi:Chemotaxis phosphatase CheX [Granulicella rosea]|uniref:Chemotaxis phosphatase CheX n=1 Tax=Granulicella rosea TaxID=474952 RepID=A0A239CW83_9BACT|nr:chemotaxis protein CheX [Granulicella rosea]SNS24038.1 Chemotaxis phosphatase CheX [Granulicella rosea]